MTFFFSVSYIILFSTFLFFRLKVIYDINSDKTIDIKFFTQFQIIWVPVHELYEVAIYQCFILYFVFQVFFSLMFTDFYF